MTFNDLRSALGSLVDILLEWFECVRHPFVTCDRMLKDWEPEQARIKRAMGIWVPSFVISVVVLTPIYQTAGIGLAKLDFHISVFLFLTLLMFSISGTTHVGLRWYGVKSRFGDTLLIYSVIIGAFSPLLNLVAYPFTAVILGSLRSSKALQLGLVDAVKAAFNVQSARMSLGYLAQLSAILTVLISLVLTGMFAEVIAKYYESNRSQVLSSMSFSAAVLGYFPTVICTTLYYYALFAFSG